MSNTIFKTDEDDFKSLRARHQDEIWDKDFAAFAKWMRNTYASTYTLAVMRKHNYDLFKEYLRNLTISVLAYVTFMYYLPGYSLWWGLPLFYLNYKYVILKEEFIHARAHWPTKMTGSESADKAIDYTMMILGGASKESFRRRHIAAHYADIGNMARVFSDVWLPFVTFPAVYYLYPHLILKIALDKEYCRKENLSRRQLFIETVGLYIYMFCVGVELYYGSHFLLVFHLIPLLVLHGGEVLGAILSHSGIDKRNSFNSNGCFDEEVPGLFRVMIWMLNTLANFFPINHGIHHAYSQLPLDVINRDYKKINKHIVENYPNIRYNEVLCQRVQKNLFSQLPPPRWYDYIVQFVYDIAMLVLAVLTIIGAPVPPPLVFECFIVDYRIFFLSKYQRYANIVGFWDAVQLEPRLREVAKANAYLVLTFKKYTWFKSQIEKVGMKPTKFAIEDICPPEVYQENVINRHKYKKVAAPEATTKSMSVSLSAE